MRINVTEELHYAASHRKHRVETDRADTNMWTWKINYFLFVKQNNNTFLWVVKRLPQIKIELLPEENQSTGKLIAKRIGGDPGYPQLWDVLNLKHGFSAMVSEINDDIITMGVVFRGESSHLLIDSDPISIIYNAAPESAKHFGLIEVAE